MKKDYFCSENYQPPAGARITDLLALNEVIVDKLHKQRAFEKWQEEQRDTDDQASESMQLLVDRFNEVFDFLYYDPDPKVVAGRVWAVMYLVRPQRLNYESLEAAADRMGVSKSVLGNYICKFRNRYPQIRLQGRPSFIKAGGGNAHWGNYLRDAGVEPLPFPDYVKERDSVLQVG